MCLEDLIFPMKNCLKRSNEPGGLLFAFRVCSKQGISSGHVCLSRLCDTHREESKGKRCFRSPGDTALGCPSPSIHLPAGDVYIRKCLVRMMFSFYVYDALHNLLFVELTKCSLGRKEGHGQPRRIEEWLGSFWLLHSAPTIPGPSHLLPLH